jgi:SPP1 gp7 family putative phage head morphogenesis protein
MELLEKAQLQKGQKYLLDLEKQYKITSANIEKELTYWYERFAVNNKISMAEARKLLTTRELKEFRWTVEEYIKYGRENAMNQAWMRELENASARVHVSRLQALKLQLQQQVEVLYGNQMDDLDRLLRDIYTDGYYHTAYEIQKGFNIGWNLHQFNEKQLDRILSKPWSTDGRTFSDRIWTNKQQLLGTLQTKLTQSVIRGEEPKKVIAEIANQFNVDRKKAGRLVMTESAAFASIAQKDCFKELGVEKFEIVATLDQRTSDICQDLDGEVFDMKDYEVGVTAPPFHPWCRTVTAPYFDDNYGERVARDEEGNVYYVPSNMKYKDWKKKFIEGGDKKELKPIKDGLFPEKIAGVKRGSPMTRDEANGRKPNPNFDKSNEYKINCQSCVVTYEARLRGYDVQALPNTKGSVLEKLSKQTNLAWIDPATGKHPNYIFDDTATTPKKFKDFLESVVKPNERYTLEFSWQGRSRGGHIVCMDRDADGLLRLYDPQIGYTYDGIKVNAYLNRIKYTMTVGGTKMPTRPKVLRIDDKHFNLDIVDHIMEGVSK